MNGQTPVSTAIIICDHAVKEPLTGKWNLNGVFDGLIAPQFPYTYPQFCVYIDFTNAQGHYQLRLKYVDLGEERLLGKMDGEVIVPDVSERTSVVFTLKNIKFPHAGKYAFQIWANDTLLTQKIFHVVSLDQAQEE